MAPTPPEPAPGGRPEVARRAPIAIVSAGVRVPGADDLETLWARLAAGFDAVEPIPEGRFDPAALVDVPCRHGGFLRAPWDFEPEAFDIPVSAARVMDPQGRLVLELAQEALERGGLAGRRRRGRRVGVWIGCNQLPHQELVGAAEGRRAAAEALLASPALEALDDAARAVLGELLEPWRRPAPLPASALVGNLFNMLAARVSHALDLDGPAVGVDTACSASLVSVLLGIDALHRGDCDVALAGGVNLNLASSVYRYFHAAGALSATGRSRPFSAAADGFVPSEGGAVVALMRLDDALAARAPILAVLRGAASNNDGRGISPMAPRPEGQRRVLAAAYADAGCDPASVALVEAHGTGTQIGDSVEAQVLAEHFPPRPDGSPRWLGSIKSNLGHLLGAAGVAGLLKASLALHHRAIPASLHCPEPDPRYGLDPARWRVPSRLEPWPEGPAPRRAGVNAFGFGGTNAHAVLEEAPSRRPAVFALGGLDGHDPLAVSAPSEARLDGLLARLDDADLPRTAATVELAAGRPLGPARAFSSSLDRAPRRRLVTGAPRVLFLCPGQGSARVGAGRGLRRSLPGFAARFDALVARLAPELGPLGEALWGADARPDGLSRTDRLQPLLVAWQIAAAEALAALGLRPDGVLGHSVGELSAAAVAGVLSAEEALEIAVVRGRRMHADTPRGRMLAVRADEAALRPLLDGLEDRAAIAAINGPQQVVLAGDETAIEALQARLQDAALASVAVPVAHPFHSPLVRAAARALADELPAPDPRPSSIAIYAPALGGRAEPAALDGDYWCRQLEAPVRFADAWAAARADGFDLVVELGPGATLTGLVGVPDGPTAVALGGARPEAGPESAAVLEALGAAWLAGAPIAWDALAEPDDGGRPPLPATPFQRRCLRFAAPPPLAEPLARRRSVLVPAPDGEAEPLPRGAWLAFGLDAARLDALRGGLGDAAARLVHVAFGPRFAREDEDRLELDPTDPRQLRWALEAIGGPVAAALVAPGRDAAAPLRVAGIAASLPRETALWTVVSEAFGDRPVPAARAAVVLAEAALHERPSRRGRAIALGSEPADADAWARAVIDELGRRGPRLVVRDSGRSTRGLGPSRARSSPERLPDGARVWVLGGAGGVGRALATRLAAERRARLVLSGRRPADPELLDDLSSRSGHRAAWLGLDLDDPGAARVGWEAATARLGGLDLVVHAAGVAHFGPLEHEPPEARARAHALKADVAQALAEVVDDGTRVWLVSSVSAAVGPLARGFASYAAANAALDALAEREHARGRPWRSLAWTLWRDVGMGARFPGVEGGGLRPVPASIASGGLWAAETTADAHVVLLHPEDARRHADPGAPSSPAAPERAGPQVGPPPPVPGRALDDAGQDAAPDPAPRSEPTPGAPQGPDAPPPAPPEPEASTPGDGLAGLLRHLLADALEITPAAVDPDVPFQSLGLESLRAVEVVRRLQTATGQALSPTLLFEHDTARRLSAHLEASGVRLASEPPPPAVPAGPSRPPPPEPAPPATADPPRPPAEARRDAPESSPTRLAILPAQATFYAQQRFHPELPSTILLRLELDGPVEGARLARVVPNVVARHPALTAALVWAEGPRLELRPGRRVALRLLPTDGLGPEAHAAAVDTAAAELWRTPFELEAEPLLRLAWAPGPSGGSLLLAVHHGIADAWSAHRVAAELLQAHEADAGRGPGLGPPPPPYEAVIQQLLTPASAAAQAASDAFWRESLADPPRLELPWDGDPEQPPKGPPGLRIRRLEPEAWARLEARARAWAVSPFNVLLASQAAALADWTGSPDVLVRVAQARRDPGIDGIERVVGCFADSPPIRLRDARLPPEALARAARSATLAALRHPLTSSLALAGVAGRGPAAGPTGVTPAGLSFPSFPTSTGIGALRMLRATGGSASGFTGLGLIAWALDGRLELAWNHLEDRLRPATVDRLADAHLARLLDWIDDRPRVAGSERKPAAGARPGRPPDAPDLGTRVVRALARDPARPCVVEDGGTLDAAGLLDDSARVAGALIARGLGPGDRVGVLAAPGARAAVGLLGVLRAGAAYVPIDPAYPPERIARLVAHARLAQVLTTSSALPRLDAALERLEAAQASLQGGTATTEDLQDSLHAPSSTGRASSVERVLLDLGAKASGATPWSALEAGPPPAEGRAGPDDLAYVMYTSGTTGRPKGVMVPHRAVRSFHDWVHEAFAIDASDRFVWTSALSFGGSIRQLWSPLLAGAETHPLPAERLRDPAALLDALESRGITIWNSVPTLWRRLLDGALARTPRPRLDALRWILIGGEKVPPALVRDWFRHFGPRVRVANLYGSTESIVNASWHELTPTSATEHAPTEHVPTEHVPIGHARSGSVLHLLDPRGLPIERAATPGELVVGGPSLADGYLFDDAATAEAFVEHPRLGRIYRTGDRAQWDAEGRAVYLGRLDDQVQVHGVRVEPAEIELALEAHPAVDRAAVVGRRHDETTTLSAFVKLRDGAAWPGEPALRRHLAERLPAAMIPHRLQRLPALPLTAAGKLDRRALRDFASEPTAAPSEADDASPTERLLRTIWCEVLGRDALALDDDFFALGGDSILAIDALERLRGRVPVVPRPITLYAHRSVRSLASAIDAAATSAGGDLDSSEAPSAHADADDAEDAESAPSPAQAGWLLAHHLHPEQAPVWVAELPLVGEVEPDRLVAAFDALVDRHSMLRTVFESRGLRTVQCVRPTARPRLACVTSDEPGAAARRAAIDARFEALRRAPMDLARGPLVTAELWSFGDEHRLLLAVHHAIADAFALEVLAREWVVLERALAHGTPVPLGPPPAHAAVLRALAARPARAEALEFWRTRFADAPEETPLGLADPTGAGPGTARGHRTSPSDARLRASLADPTGAGPETTAGHRTSPSGGHTRGLELDARELAALRAACARWRSTPSLVLLTAWARTVGHLRGTDDVLLGLAVSGRDLPVPGIAEVVAPLVTGLPLRLRLGGASFEADLRRVEAAVAEHLAHADLPADRLAAALAERSAPGDGLARGLVGTRAFFSCVDLQRRAVPDAPWGLALEAGRTAFASETTPEAASLNITLGETARLNLNARLAPAAMDRVLTALRAELPIGAPLLAPAGPRLDAALVGYLPRLDGLEALGDAPATLRARLFPDGAPRLIEHRDTRLGRTGFVLLPLDGADLGRLSTRALAERVAIGVELAARAGAGVVSLAGLLPAHTGYGHAVVQALGPRGLEVRLTTGHGATVAAVVGTLARVLASLDRRWSEAQVAVVGLGSVGRAALALALARWGRPRALVLCDAPRATRLALDTLGPEAAEARAVSALPGRLPDAVYEADLWIGAAGAGDLLDIERLRPGTVVVDDSFPPLVAPARAWARMRARRDVLVLGGGVLDAGQGPPVPRVHDLPEAWVALALARFGRDGLAGCRAESLLLAAEPGLQPVMGPIEPEQAAELAARAEARGLVAAPLHLGAEPVDAALLEALRGGPR